MTTQRKGPHPGTSLYMAPQACSHGSSWKSDQSASSLADRVRGTASYVCRACLIYVASTLLACSPRLPT